MKKYPYLIPIILFILSLLLRLHLISKGPYHLDTLNLMINAEKTLATFQLQNQFGSGYPLTVLLAALFISIERLLTNAEPIMAVNMVSVIFSSLSIVALHLIAKKLFGSTTALLSAGLLCVSPIFLGTSVYGMSHAPSIFFLLLSIYYLLLYKETHRLYLLWISALALGSMGACRLQDMILIIAPLIYLYWINLANQTHHASFQNRAKLFLGWIFIVAATCFAFHLPYLTNKLSSSYQQQFSHYFTIGLTDNFGGIFSPYLKRTLAIIIQNLTTLGIAGFLLGVIILFIVKPKTAIFILLWVLCPLMFYGNIVTVAPRFFSFIIPGLVLPLGYIFAVLINNKKKFLILILGIYGFIIFASLDGVYDNLRFRHRHAALPEYVRWTSSITEPNALIITADDMSFYEHYGNRKIWQRPLDHLGRTNMADIEKFKVALDIQLANNLPVYISGSGLFTYNEKNIFSNFMDQNYLLVKKGRHLYEDWHRGELEQVVFESSFYQILPKSTAAPSL